MKTKIAIIAALFASAMLGARGQDIVIGNKNDTVRGELSHNAAGQYKFKTPDGKTIDVDLNTISEFYTQDKKTWVRRLYITNARTPCYLDVVLTGKLNLYIMGDKHLFYNGALAYSRNQQGADPSQPRIKTQYFVAKTDEAQLVMNDDLSRSQSKELLDTKFLPFIQDNTSIVTLYQSEKHIGADELKNLVSLYNK